MSKRRYSARMPGGGGRVGSSGELTVTGSLAFGSIVKIPASLAITIEVTGADAAGYRLAFSGDTGSFKVVGQGSATIDHTCSAGDLAGGLLLGDSHEVAFLPIPVDLDVEQSMTITVYDDANQVVDTVVATCTSTDAVVILHAATASTIGYWTPYSGSLGNCVSGDIVATDMMGEAPSLKCVLALTGNWEIISELTLSPPSLNKAIEADVRGTANYATLVDLNDAAPVSGYLVFSVQGGYASFNTWVSYDGYEGAPAGSSVDIHIWNTTPGDMGLNQNNGAGQARIEFTATTAICFFAWRKSGNTVYTYGATASGSWLTTDSYASASTWVGTKGMSIFYPNATAQTGYRLLGTGSFSTDIGANGLAAFRDAVFS